jgi:hypothetical protein
MTTVAMAIMRSDDCNVCNNDAWGVKMYGVSG